MLRWLKRIFSRSPEPTADVIDIAEWEEHRQTVIREAFRTGKPVIGTLDEDGKLVMKVLEFPEKKK